MPVVTSAEISALQKKTRNIRNICILAHVDHGKTTLADSLIASNGVISNRLAGKLRYMDSREDEQKRGITMKSSAISLHHSKGGEHYLINLIDSPGHIDFSSEVSTAVRLCDGALVMVDVVEGVCPQTHAVLRQAWLENVKPCLVLNKIDRLITELKMSPLESYLHLQQILEQVNGITATLFTSDVMAKTASTISTPSDKNEAHLSDQTDQTYDWSSGLDEADDSSLYFCPDQRNVVFASAIDGWAFGIDQFAELYSEKVGVSVNVLKKTLWGDFYLNTKTKRIMRGAAVKAKKPLFVQLILENLWNVYETVLERRDKEKTEKILSSLKLTVSARDAKYTDARTYLQAIMRQWLPLSRAVLDMVCGVLPSPHDLSQEKIKKLLSGDSYGSLESFSGETKKLYQALESCSSLPSAPVIGFVSKMFSVSQEALPKYKRKPLTAEELRVRREKAREKHAQRVEGKAGPCSEETQESLAEEESRKQETEASKDEEVETASETFIAFARIFSGTVRKGDTLFVLGPKYDPRKHSGTNFDEHPKEDSVELSKDTGLGISDSLGSYTVSKFKIDNLYLMMGREFEELDEIPAGNVLGINGLADHVLKSATISSTLACPSFTPMPFEAKPIVRVAVEPEQPSALPALRRGLKLLNQADPCVEVFVQETGEYVISVAGEVHLKKCLDDLSQVYAGIELSVSAPIIPFRETVIPPPKIDMVNEEISGDDHRDNIQRLPAFMQREIQDWAETIQKSNRQKKEAEEPDEREKEWSSGKEGRRGKLADGLIEARTANGQCMLSVRAVPLPGKVVNLLEANSDIIKIIVDISAETDAMERRKRVQALRDETRNEIQSFHTSLEAALNESGNEWKNTIQRIWAFGPRRVGPNILLNRIGDYDRPSIWCGLLPEAVTDITEGQSEPLRFRNYDNSVVSGFQLATVSGPMCEEPMMGICFCVEQWSYIGERKGIDELAAAKNAKTESDCVNISASITDMSDMITGQGSTDVGDSCNAENEQEEIGQVLSTTPKDSRLTTQDTYGPLSGQIISSMKEVCRRAFMGQPMRLMAAMYSCDIQATSDVLGKMYAVIGRREGRITNEEMKEGSDTFQVTAVLPVAESFGFAEEIRKKTSGLASPLLYFSHWEVISVDPFWKPTTEEEYLLYGEKADSENQALKYVNSVRKRKGLYVEQKTVEFAEKQRTLKRNK